jgi:hypothetical protein
MASTAIRRAATDPQSSQTTGTFSVWVKKAAQGAYQTIYNHRYNNSYEFKFMFFNDDTLYCLSQQNGTRLELRTNRRFRDPNAWYHIVLAVDSTQGTASDRAKLYVNGVQETSFSTETYPTASQGLGLDGGASYYYNLGSRGDGSSEYFDGVMSHFHFVDGSQLAPTVFGSTDSTTGEWKINTSPSYTVGTKGFFILKDGNSLTDQSANSNDFSSYQGTLTKTEDNPSNVFATWNPLNSNPGSTINFTNGNTHVSPASDSSYMYAGSTLAMPKKTGSKFYAEFLNYGVQGGLIGIGTMDTLDNAMRQNVDISNNATYTDFGRAVYRETGNGQIYYVTGEVNTNVTMSNNDIQQIAIDLENGKFYVGKNGTWTLSGDPANNSGGLDISSASWYTNNDLFCFVAGSYTGVGSGNYRANFGNGYFGTTAVSSAGTNASNNGIFEYDVPSGFTALSTKGLNL